MEQLQTELENAAKGLIFMSETGAPLEPIDLSQQDKTAFTHEAFAPLLQSISLSGLGAQY